MTDITIRTAAQDAVRRMRAMWPAHRWGDAEDPSSAAREYGLALLEIPDAGAIARGTTAAIREVGGRFPPPVAELLEYVRAEIPRPEPAPLPAVIENRCPVCREQGLETEVVVDPGTRLASCVEGVHGYSWRVG